MHSIPSCPPPPIFKYAVRALAALLIALSLYFVWHAFLQPQAPWLLLLASGFALTGIGLLRGLAWARFAFSCVSVMLAFAVATRLIPDIDDRHNGGTALEQMWGTWPPLWVGWLTVVAGSVLPLLPAVLIGWRKSWFRHALW